MDQPRVLILRAAGVNCEIETAHAWALAGAVADVRHINELRANPRQLHEYQILTIPGGFSYGDDISAGKILANELLMFLGESLREFAARERLILGICNGFQVLCKAGLLPGGHQDADLPLATITANLSGKYEDRWVHLARPSEKCIFLSQARAYELPVAHGEGRVVTSTEQGMHEVTEQGCVALRYQAPGGGSASYPDNPNGSMSDVAGLCDPSGRIFGLMPHPERFIHHTQHPEWTSRESNLADGLAVFASAVAFFK